ncbi:hypothetical protein [Streptacidiphilus fuscans]|uniref:Antitoxin n=1 Tax=Streptacidiphilus fuscans TaxID=2789292 RepID=A0A931B8I6_9ACTN|nr:hypothetical protein [Streptacidiphilus fuscans]MBF9069773.1 hypothetical protein [Streptacidiphilus fuscans]
MSAFGDFARDAEDIAKQDPSLVDEGLQQVENFADQETGNHFDSEISQGFDQVEQTYGGGQDQQGQQNQ